VGKKIHKAPSKTTAGLGGKQLSYQLHWKAENRTEVQAGPSTKESPISKITRAMLGAWLKQ
jgi:hypothetical protein